MSNIRNRMEMLLDMVELKQPTSLGICDLH